MNTKQITRTALAAIAILYLVLHAMPHAHGQEAHGHAPSTTETTAEAGQHGDLTISQAFSRATLPNAPVGGGYLTIANSGIQADRLVSVASPAAGAVQIHEMKMEGDVMKMRPVEGGLEIPAGGSVTLEPGGLHLMFMQLKQPFVEGENVEVTLQFEKVGPVEVSLPVLAPAAKTAPAHHANH